MNHYRVLATDYDGTVASDGVVDELTLDALRRWKLSGRQLILITGRQFDDLLQTFEPMELFDLVVPENGAMLYHPHEKWEKLLAPPPPTEFIQELRDRISSRSKNPPAISGEFSTLVQNQKLEWLGVGRVIVATWIPHDVTVHELIQSMNLDLHIVMNKRAVMVLPKGVSKESGLMAALDVLNIPSSEVVGVGDAENDAAFLKLCGYSVAVDNALPTLKEQVDWVTPSSRGRGVVELINQILDNQTDQTITK